MKHGTPLLDGNSEIKDKRFMLLQVGDTGSGKTTRALTASKYGPMLILDFDGKVASSGRHVPPEIKDHIIPDNVYMKDLSTSTMSQIAEAIKSLRADFNSGQAPIATLVIDTYTNLNERIYMEVMGSKLERGIKADYDDWGKLKNALTCIFRDMYALPCNLIVNCHAEVGIDDLGKKSIGIKGAGRFADSLPTKFGDTHFLSIEGTKGAYKARVKNSAYFGVNTKIDPKYIDADGFANVPHLDIFDGFAFKTQDNQRKEKKDL